MLADIGSRSASPGAELVISLSATDTDVPQNALAYARNGTAGAITATDSRAASFAWTPTGSDLGAHVIRFTVSDGAGGTDSEDVIVTVSDDDDDDAPAITSARVRNVHGARGKHARADVGQAGRRVCNRINQRDGKPGALRVGQHAVVDPVRGAGRHRRRVQGDGIGDRRVADNVGTQDVIITVAETNEDPVLAGIGPSERDDRPGADHTADGDGHGRPAERPGVRAQRHVGRHNGHKRQGRVVCLDADGLRPGGPRDQVYRIRRRGRQPTPRT